MSNRTENTLTPAPILNKSQIDRIAELLVKIGAELRAEFDRSEMAVNHRGGGAIVETGTPSLQFQ